MVFDTINQDELTGWEKCHSDRQGERELEKLPVVSSKNTSTSNVLVEVKNGTGSDLTYSGYGKTMPRLFFNKKEGKAWVAADWHWCGTGLSSYTLKNKQSIVFELYDFKSHMNRANAQVFTIFEAKGRERSSMVKLLSSLFRDSKGIERSSMVKLYEKDNG